MIAADCRRHFCIGGGPRFALDRIEPPFKHRAESCGWREIQLEVSLKGPVKGIIGYLLSGRWQIIAVMEMDVVKAPAAVVGEVLPARGSIEARAESYWRAQASPETRKTYRTALGRLLGVVGTEGADLDADHVNRLRDQLMAEGLAASTVAVYLSAVRGFAAAIGADPMIKHVKAPRRDPGEPKALSAAEVQRLLKMPDRRTMRGVRDYAVLRMLLDAGPRANELSGVDVDHIELRRRAEDGGARTAIRNSTFYWLVIVEGKRGKRRSVPMTQALVDALRDWQRVRPNTDELDVRDPACRALFLSQPRKAGAPPTRLSKRAVHTIVSKHAAAAGVRPDRQHPHALRHTFCTQLARAGARLEVIQKLAGHADIATTTIYTETDAEQMVEAIEAVGPKSGLEVLG